uniref:Uncharacterized protein n=1 Tax=Auxenochlorella protothecoides TaxID=3075 RepID=A0A1D1ZS71_AUXPR
MLRPVVRRRAGKRAPGGPQDHRHHAGWGAGGAQRDQPAHRRAGRGPGGPGACLPGPDRPGRGHGAGSGGAGQDRHPGPGADPLHRPGLMARHRSRIPGRCGAGGAGGAAPGAGPGLAGGLAVWNTGAGTLPSLRGGPGGEGCQVGPLTVRRPCRSTAWAPPPCAVPPRPNPGLSSALLECFCHQFPTPTLDEGADRRDPGAPCLRPLHQPGHGGYRAQRPPPLPLLRGNPGRPQPGTHTRRPPLVPAVTHPRCRRPPPPPPRVPQPRLAVRLRPGLGAAAQGPCSVARPLDRGPACAAPALGAGGGEGQCGAGGPRRRRHLFCRPGPGRGAAALLCRGGRGRPQQHLPHGRRVWP